MKVSKLNYNFQSNDISPKEKLIRLQQNLAEYKNKEDSASARCAFGKAMVNMQNSSSVSSSNTPLDEIQKVINSIAQQHNAVVYRVNTDKSSLKDECIVIRAKAGSPIPNWNGLYNDDFDITCYCDDNSKLKEVYLQNKKARNVQIFNSDGVICKEFTTDDMEALKEYKYRPEQFHRYLRDNRSSRLITEENLWDFIEKIDNCFKQDKAFKVDKETVVYRALQNNLSESDKLILSTTGAVYRDNSYVSTTTDINTARRFNTADNPILKITLPQGTSYLDMDRLFNIDYQHWNEQEYLLKRGSEFLVTGYDEDNNIIEACYLGR